MASVRGANAAIALQLDAPMMTIAPGDSFVVRAEVVSEDSTFNAFDLVVRFDPAMVSFLPTSPLSGQAGPLMTDACSSVFHVFNATADSTVADMSLLCGGTFVSGPGTLYQLKFRSNGARGVANFTAGPSTRFLKAGVSMMPVLDQGISVVVGNVLGATRRTAVSRDFVLEAPRPNPARSGEGAIVNFRLPKPARVALALFDMQGRQVAGLRVGDAPAGATVVRWDMAALPAGRYELRLRADAKIVARQAWVVLR